MTAGLAFPSAFGASDQAAALAQSRFLLVTRLQLILLVVAGAASVFTLRAGRLEVAALVGATAFAAAAVIRLAVTRRGFHRIWYEARAAAESIKTLSWRYAVGGNPFPLDGTDPDEALADQIGDVLEGLSTLDGMPSTYEPTPTMRSLRATPSERRREVYLRERVEDQLAWYEAKARWNRARARRWGISILVLQVLGAGADSSRVSGSSISTSLVWRQRWLARRLRG